jgi:hypothetical protein
MSNKEHHVNHPPRPAKRPLPRTILTTNPDPPAPSLLCPLCEKPLVYRSTALAGLNPPERWDFIDCRKCGLFEYRHRTGIFRRVKATAA